MKPLNLPKVLLRATALLAAAFASTSNAAAAEARRPNFLFVYTDDQRWDAMGVVQREMGDKGRYPFFVSPAMDRLAAEGVRFRNAFVTLSLCAPSRAAFLTGRYNHLNGVSNNHTRFPEDNVTHATLLRAAGYKTAYIGKWHMGAQRGQRPGFDYSASFIGQGQYVDCPFEVNGVSQPTKGWVDDVSTDFAIAFMKEHKDEPFSMVVGFKSPHGPTRPPVRTVPRFKEALARRVPNLDSKAPFRDEADVAATAGPVEGGTEGAGEVKVNVNYFRCVSGADDCLGRLLGALDELGLAGDTVVIFTSDNGYYHGEHGLGDKRSLYEESLRIPMLVRYPRAFPKGRTVDELALNIDVAPTLLDLAGVPAPAAMQGRSLRPLLEGKAAPAGWRQAFIAEYFEEKNYPNTPTMSAVRTASAKLIKYAGHEDWTELFDLASDPYETKNLARDPAQAGLLESMKAEYEREAKAVGFTVPAGADVQTPADTPPRKRAGRAGKVGAASRR